MKLDAEEEERLKLKRERSYIDFFYLKYIGIFFIKLSIAIICMIIFGGITYNFFSSSSLLPTIIVYVFSSSIGLGSFYKKEVYGGGLQILLILFIGFFLGGFFV